MQHVASLVYSGSTVPGLSEDSGVMVGLSVFCPVGLISLSFLAILLLLLLDGLSMQDSIEEALNDIEVEILLGKDERVLLRSPTRSGSLLALCLVGLCSRLSILDTHLWIQFLSTVYATMRHDLLAQVNLLGRYELGLYLSQPDLVSIHVSSFSG